MLETIAVLAAMIFFYRQSQEISGAAPADSVVGARPSSKLLQLTDYAARLYKEKKFLAAEKAYLAVLKVDHKNVLSYNRLGMIYAALRNYEDAIECFQIVCKYSPSAQSYYNLGLAYGENRNYIKAISMVEKSLLFEQSANRYIALAKLYQRILNRGKTILALEKAAELEPNKRTYEMLVEAYKASGERDKLQLAYRRILELDPSDPVARRFAAAS